MANRNPFRLTLCMVLLTSLQLTACAEDKPANMAGQEKPAVVAEAKTTEAAKAEEPKPADTAPAAEAPKAEDPKPADTAPAAETPKAEEGKAKAAEEDREPDCE